MNAPLRIGVAIAALAAVRPAAAQSETPRFAVVDLSATAGGTAREQVWRETVVAQVEQDIARLRPGTAAITDPVMRRLLATGEGPAAAAARLAREAEDKHAAGDCAAAAALAAQAESIALASISLDDERDLLKRAYVVEVACAHKLGRVAERDVAARRLRALVGVAPPGLPADLWDGVVARASAGAATTELQIDSEPANAQVQIDLHGDGVTPRTLKVAPGRVFVEVQKDGYLKGFRALDVGNTPARTVFRLVQRTHDRVDQTLAALRLLHKNDPAEHTGTLAKLAQLARADSLVLLNVEGDRARLRFFDAERGGLGAETIDSAVDAGTGRLAALVARKTASAGTTPGKTASAAGAASAAASAAATSAGAPVPDGALPEAQARHALAEHRTYKKPSTPWWSWVIAGAVGASLATFVLLDRPQTRDTLQIQAAWGGPTTPP